MPDKNKLCATLRFLSYGVLCCQSMIPAIIGQPVAGEAELAGRILTGALSFTGVFAAGALGNSFYDAYFRSGSQIFQNRSLIDVTGEAMSGALKQIVEANTNGTNVGIEKLGDILGKTKDNWFRLTLTELQPEINHLSTGEIKALLEDPNISTDDNLSVLINELTLARSGESYLDDETIAFVAGELETKLPAAFTDVLTDEQSGKPYRQVALNFLSNLYASNQEILALLKQQALIKPERALPSNLPTVRDFIGRGGELGDLRESYKNGKRVFLLHGVGGVGKTALALEFAAEIKGNYAAHILVDMQGLNRPTLAAEAAMYEVVKQFEPKIPATLSPNDLHGLYAQFLTEHSTLLVLDNADDALQIEPLNVLENSCLLVTSRRRFDLAAGEIYEVEKMSETDANKLLISIAGAERLGEKVAELAERCGRLPLALRAAASALKKNRLIAIESYIGKLQDRKERLRLQDPTRQNLTVEAAFDLSYELLGADLQLRWRQLAVFPADFGADGVATVWSTHMDNAQETLNELDGYSLLVVDEETGRFALHDLARDYTTEKLTSAELAAVQRLHAKHYAQLLRFVQIKRKDDYQGALVLLDLEWNNITAGQKWSADLADTDKEAARTCLDYSGYGTQFVALRLHPREFIEWQTVAFTAAKKLEAKQAQGNHLGNLGTAYRNLGDHRKAIEYHEQALEISRQIGDRRGESSHLTNMGIAYKYSGEHRQAIEYFEQALEISRDIGERQYEGNILGNLGLAYRHLGEYRKAIEYVEQGLEVSRDIGDQRDEGSQLGGLGIAYLNLGEYQTAIEYLKQALEISRLIGDRQNEGIHLSNFGIAYQSLGETEKACGLWQEALAILKEIESPIANHARQ